MKFADWQVNTTSMIMVVASEGAKKKLGARYTAVSWHITLLNARLHPESEPNILLTYLLHGAEPLLKS